MSKQLEATISGMQAVGAATRVWSRAPQHERSLYGHGVVTMVSTPTNAGYLTLVRMERPLRKSLYTPSLHVVDTVYSDKSRSYVVADSVTTRQADSALAMLFESANDILSGQEKAKSDAHASEVADRRRAAVAELGGF